MSIFISLTLLKTAAALLCTNSKITIKGGLGNPYPYCIKWKLAEMKYKLEVHKLSLVSDLIKVNHIFRVNHKWK